MAARANMASAAAAHAAPAVRRIDSRRDIRVGIAALCEVCPHMRRAHSLAGDPPLRRDTGGFEGLARIIIGQQVSTASADAIWGRLAARLPEPAADSYLQLGPADHAAIGLSRPKIRSLESLARAVTSGALDFDALAAATDETVRDRLLGLHGIGPWSADIYLLVCLGRADAFAPGDLALQAAATRLMRLRARPNAAELTRIAERWRPWRAVAARLLWAYYRVSSKPASGAPL